MPTWDSVEVGVISRLCPRLGPALYDTILDALGHLDVRLDDFDEGGFPTLGWAADCDCDHVFSLLVMH